MILYVMEWNFHQELLEKDLETKFSALFNAFKYGPPPHAGMAPGIDRIVDRRRKH